MSSTVVLNMAGYRPNLGQSMATAWPSSNVLRINFHKSNHSITLLFRKLSE